MEDGGRGGEEGLVVVGGRGRMFELSRRRFARSDGEGRPGECGGHGGGGGRGGGGAEGGRRGRVDGDVRRGGDICV